GQRTRLQPLTGILPLRAAGIAYYRAGIGARQQYTGLLESFAYGRAHQATRRGRIAIKPLRPYAGRVTCPRHFADAIGLVNTAAGKHVHARSEFHRGLTAHHVGLDPGVTVAHQDDGGRIARRYGLAGLDRILAHGCGNRHSHHWTSTVRSTSTGASIGNTATPTALRA